MFTYGQRRVWSAFNLKALRTYIWGGMGQFETGVFVCVHMHTWLCISVLLPCALPQEQKGLLAVLCALRVIEL